VGFRRRQTSDLAKPEHVYLGRGLYSVKLTFRRAGKDAEITNRIEIDRPNLTRRESNKEKEKGHTLDDYLKILETYDPKTRCRLAAATRLAFEAKSLNLENKPDDAKRYLTKAVQAGKAAFAEDSAATAMRTWRDWRARSADGAHQAGRFGGRAVDLERSDPLHQITNLKAECEIAAADILITDLAKPAEAKPLLDVAAAQWEKPAAVPWIRLCSVFGAITTRPRAMASPRGRRTLPPNKPEQNAKLQRKHRLKGAHSRSAEVFIKEKQFDRAAQELFAWQHEFPAESRRRISQPALVQVFFQPRDVRCGRRPGRTLAGGPCRFGLRRSILLLSADLRTPPRQERPRLGHFELDPQRLSGSPLVPLVKKNIEMLKKK